LVWELLTGSSIRGQPQWQPILSALSPVVLVQRRNVLEETMFGQLRIEAERQLSRLRIDEPVLWQPLPLARDIGCAWDMQSGAITRAITVPVGRRFHGAARTMVPADMASVLATPKGRTAATYVATVVEQGGFYGPAAAMCDITADTLAHQIRILEQTMGCRLLERRQSKHPAQLTPTGAELMESLRRLPR